jgi:small subunit ribosomal protein S17e
MGKVRQDKMKRMARELVEKFPDRFSTDFEANKKVVPEVLDVGSKILRNRIVGYVTHLKRIEKMRQPPVREVAAEPEE